jgi:hypothetical protein
MADGTGIGCFGVGAAVYFRELTHILVTSGSAVAGTATTDSLSLTLVLQSLVIIREQAGRYHRMRAGVTARAVNVAMPGSIAVQRRLGIDLSNVAVAGSTFRFGSPGRSLPGGNRTRYLA